MTRFIVLARGGAFVDASMDPAVREWFRRTGLRPSHPRSKKVLSKVRVVLATHAFDPTMVTAWRARRLEEPAVRWFRELVVEVAATL